MRATYSDKPTAVPQTLSDAQSAFAQVNKFIEDNSFHTLSLAPMFTDVIILPHPESYYFASGEYTLHEDAMQAAAAANPAWNARDYDIDVVRYDNGPGVFGGMATLGGGDTWIKSNTPYVLAHELGHNLGLNHSNAWMTSATGTVTGAGEPMEYGDPFDVMGSAHQLGGHFNPDQKHRLGWIRDDNVPFIDSSGVYRLYAHDVGDTRVADQPYALRIERGEDQVYWLDYRLRREMDLSSEVTNGVTLHWTPPYYGPLLVDTDPRTALFRDAPVVFGETYSDLPAGIHVTPLGRTPGVARAIDVQVNFGFFPNNKSPTLSASASATSVPVGTVVNFSASATDPDGDLLAYHWDFGDGAFGPNATTTSHAFAAPGQYVVRATASDMKGRTASRSLVIKVGSPAPTGYSLSGQVLDSTGGPIPGAMVRALDPLWGDRAVYTDSDGRYAFAGLRSGTYTLSAFKAGWTAAAQFSNPVNVTGGDVPSRHFVAAVNTYELSGHVSDAEQNTVFGATVSAGGVSTTSDQFGNFSLNLPAGQHELTATAPGLGVVRRQVLVDYGPTKAGVQFQTALLTARVEPVEHRFSPVPSLKISFNQPVTGFDISDLVLSRNEGPNLLTGTESLTSSDAMHFTLTDVYDLTAPAGDYALYVMVDNSGIASAAGSPLAWAIPAQWHVSSWFGIDGGEGDDIFRLAQSPASPQFVDLFINNPTATPDYQVYRPTMSQAYFQGRGGNDTVIIDASLPVFPEFWGGSGIDTLRITAGDYGLGLDRQGQVDELRLGGNARLNLVAPLVLGSLFLDGAARLTADAFTRLASLSIADQASFDPLDNDLLIDTAWASQVRDLLRDGKLRTSTPTRDGRSASLAYAQGDDPSVAIDGTFHDHPVGAASVLLKHTYNGDANLDGAVDLDDYFLIDSNFLARPEHPTWSHGDFNYDGELNLDDYFLIDSAFLEQPRSTRFFGSLTVPPARLAGDLFAAR